jgi:hypothetical protein
MSSSQGARTSASSCHFILHSLRMNRNAEAIDSDV